MVLFSEMYLSELRGVNVVDRLQEQVGQVKDFLLTVGDVFPKVTALLINKHNSSDEVVILMSEIDIIGKQFIVTKSPKDRIVYTTPRQSELFLWQDIMDKQIVDTEGARVIRVNDLKLGKINQDVRLLAADVGFKGLLRRMGWLGFVTAILKLFHLRIPELLIGWDHVEQLKTGQPKGLITVPSRHLAEMHPSDIASVISQVHQAEKTAIFTSLSENVAAEALHELEPKIQALLLMTLDTKKSLSILEKMPTDEVADVLGDLPTQKAEEFLRLLRPKKANEVRNLLSHPDETAGGLMTTEFVAVKDCLTVQETIEHMRQVAKTAETIYYLYVLDNYEKLVGVLSLRDVLVSPAEQKICDLMITDVISIKPEEDRRKVAQLASKYNFLALPVVDRDNKMLGIVTIDDVIDFILPPISRRMRHLLG